MNIPPVPVVAQNVGGVGPPGGNPILVQAEMVAGAAGSSTDRTVKKRRRLEKTQVTTRWACPREITQNSKGPAQPVADCSKCHGQGCTMEVFASATPAEEYVYVTDRNEKFNKFMCRACGDIFSGTQSRIVSHRLRVSGRGVMPCPIEPTEDVKLVLEPLEAELSSKHNWSDRKKKGDDKKKDASDKTRVRLTEEADVSIARFFYECGIPFSRSEHPAFLRMVSAVAAVGDRYQPPTQSRITDNSPAAKTADSRAKAGPGGTPAGLLHTCLKAVREEQEGCVASTTQYGATMACDGAKHAGASCAITHVLATNKGKVFVALTDAARGELTPEFLAEDAAAAIRKVNEQNVFLTVMDGPDMASQALKLLQRVFPRMLTMRSAVWGWDLVLQEIARKFRTHVLAPVNRILLHITNHSFIYSVFEGLDVANKLLEPLDTRFPVEIMCVRAFFADKNNIILLWGHPEIQKWLEERDPMRGIVRSRQTKLGLEHIHKHEWWRLVESCVAVINTAVPMVAETDLDAPNLYKLPLMFDQACASLQQPLAFNGQDVDPHGMTIGGVRVSGRPGDGSVQGSVLELVRASKDAVVSEAALAAAMVYPPFVYQEPIPYEPEGGRAAFNAVAQRYFGGSEEVHVQCLTAFNHLRNRSGPFSPASGSAPVKRLASQDVLTFYETVCTSEDLKPLSVLAIKLLNACGTLAASDGSTREAAQAVKSWLLGDKAENLMQIRMHYRLKLRGRQAIGLSAQHNVLFDVRKHWLMQRRAVLEGAQPGIKEDMLQEARMGLSELLIQEDEQQFLDVDISQPPVELQSF